MLIYKPTGHAFIVVTISVFVSYLKERPGQRRTMKLLIMWVLMISELSQDHAWSQVYIYESVEQVKSKYNSI